MAKVTYPVSISFTEVETNKKYSITTQLYKIGIYVIGNNDPNTQANSTPQQVRKVYKNCLKAEKQNEIKDLEVGRMITVTNKSGFWEELKT